MQQPDVTLFTRQINILLLASTLLNLSCEKGKIETTHTQIINNTLEGTWIWESTSGGFAGTTQTPASTGNTAKLIINDGVMTYYTDDSISDIRNYTIVEGLSIFTSDSTELIQFDSLNIKQYYQLEDDILILSDECYDCYQYNYTRQ